MRAPRFWRSTPREIEALSEARLRYIRDQQAYERELWAVERADFRNAHFRSKEHHPKAWTVDEILGRKPVPTRVDPLTEAGRQRIKLAASGMLNGNVPDWAKLVSERTQ